MEKLDLYHLEQLKHHYLSTLDRPDSGFSREEIINAAVNEFAIKRRICRIRTAIEKNGNDVTQDLFKTYDKLEQSIEDRWHARKEARAIKAAMLNSQEEEKQQQTRRL